MQRGTRQTSEFTSVIARRRGREYIPAVKNISKVQSGAGVPLYQRQTSC
jgi:hypothetical protein